MGLSGPLITHDFRHKKTFDTEKFVHTDCTQKFLQTDFFACRTLPRAVFTQQTLSRTETFTQKKHMHSSFYTQTVFTQKIIRTEVLRTEGFTHNIFYIHTVQMFLHRHKLHTETCAHSTRLTQPTFRTERLCFPFLITYLSCSPSQISSTLHSTSCLNQATLCEVASKSQPQVGVTLEDLWSALCLGCLKQRKQRKHTNTPRHEMT